MAMSLWEAEQRGLVPAGTTEGYKFGAPTPWADKQPAIGSQVGKMVHDAFSAPHLDPNNYGAQAPLGPPQSWGGYDNMADVYSAKGLKGMNDASATGKEFSDAAMYPRMPQINENQELSDRESMSAGYDQAGALQLAREQAMGLAPSAAAYQMQSGLNSAMANQTAMMGGARGNAGIALAGGNAAANVANLQNQTYNQAGQLRAQEMAQGLNAYGGIAGQARGQNLERLGQASGVSTQNANNANNYTMGLGGLGAQYGNLGLGYYNGSQHPFDAAANTDLGYQQLASGNFNNAAGRRVDVATGNVNRDQQNTSNLIGLGGSTLTTAYQLGQNQSGQPTRKP